jgi:hypothetical protein
VFVGKESLNLNSQHDFVRFQEQIFDLSESLQAASRNEIELGFKLREVEKA